MRHKGFFIIDKKTNEFVCLDGGSGGYPWMFDSITSAKNFTTLAEASHYYNLFVKGYPNWEIVQLEIILNAVT